MRTRPRILVIDNYDSFVFNLVQYLGEMGAEPVVVRNDKLDAREAEDGYAGVVISPGPGVPADAGVSVEVISRMAGRAPVFGVCLGHQAMAEAFGGSVVRAPVPMHGKTSMITHDGSGVFQGIESPFRATRYHSLIVEESSLPAEFRVTARSEDGLIMGISHRDYPIWGVQFHPESIYTTHGKEMVANFVSATHSA
ncbi:MAG: aminodeoxychorismate/anthranilate synthase component II [Nitrospiraceae bacterium]|nr:aminodeoxychorismate/anthranilate synthase component II [Nitrospiraceae bacterium]